MPYSNPAPIDLFGTFLSSLGKPSEAELAELWQYCSEFKRQENSDRVDIDNFIAGINTILERRKR